MHTPEQALGTGLHDGIRFGGEKLPGAHVIGTASTKNQSFLRELGVDEPIDYQKTRFEDAVGELDVVFDTIGGETQNRSWKVLKEGGILVSIVGQPSSEKAAKHNVRSAGISARADTSVLDEIAKLIDSGKLKPIIETVLPLFYRVTEQEQHRRRRKLSGLPQKMLRQKHFDPR